jgi:lysophospholipase L1-like esterase
LSIDTTRQPGFFRTDDRVLFLGDSITFAGDYVRSMHAHLLSSGVVPAEVVNLGLASETVSGLSEPGHPFPRPCVLERLSRALREVRPTAVVACYGMNDGIYHPLSEARFAAYRTGMERLITSVKRAGARLALLTPPPFDPEPIRSRLQPAGRTDYGFAGGYVGYDEVLQTYGGWLLSLRSAAVRVADVGGILRDFTRGLRTRIPGYTLSPDGIHPHSGGHALMAMAALKGLGHPATNWAAHIDMARGKVLEGHPEECEIYRGSALLSWKVPPPLPWDASWDREVRRQVWSERGLGCRVLRITGLREPRYAVWEGATHLRDATPEELVAGIELADCAEWSLLHRAKETMTLLAEKRSTVDLAWLTHVGHKRPDTPSGRPLKEVSCAGHMLPNRAADQARPRLTELRIAPVA